MTDNKILDEVELLHVASNLYSHVIVYNIHQNIISKVDCG